MKALITGVTGFVGHYLYHYLSTKTNMVYGTSRKNLPKENIYHLNLLKESEIIDLLKNLRPTHIFHLAGVSNVKDSWSMKAEVIEANTIGTINLLEAVKKVDKNIKVITVGSSEEYGLALNNNHQTTEEEPLNPLSPYGASKAAVSMLVAQYCKADRLDVIHVRPFNHIGPGQRLGFVTSDFAYQIALINKGKIQQKQMKVGNLEAIRDFTDVRDIAKAYYQLAVSGIPGQIYNVCSSSGTKIQRILDILLSYSEKNIEIKLDPERMRPSEIPRIVGDHSKIIKLTNWRPEISLNQSLSDIYKFWLSKG